MLPKSSAYVKTYDGKTKWTYFTIKDDKLLKQYDDTWNKVSQSIKKNLIGNPLTIKYFENQNKILL